MGVETIVGRMPLKRLSAVLWLIVAHLGIGYWYWSSYSMVEMLSPINLGVLMGCSILAIWPVSRAFNYPKA